MSHDYRCSIERVCCSCVMMFSFLRQRTDESEGLWMITGTESWPGYMVLTNSETIQLTNNMLHGVTEAYDHLYYTKDDERKSYGFDEHQFLVEPTSITAEAIKFYEVQIGRDRFCGIEHHKEYRAADAYVMKHGKDGKIRLFAVQIQYFIRHQVCVQYRSHPSQPYHKQDEWHTFAVVLHYKATAGMKEMGQDIRNPNVVAFQMDLENIQDRYGIENFVPIRQIAGRFIKVPAVSYAQFMAYKRKKQESRHLPATTGIYCSALPPRL